MSTELITVIIPTYNRAALLGRAIRSALAQEGVRMQVVVADDGSTDDTRAVVAGFAGVEYYHQPNRGQGAARNLGLRHARGGVIASLDSDDEWGPGFLAAAVAALDEHGLDFVFLNWTNADGSENYFDRAVRQRPWRRFLAEPVGDWQLLAPALARRLFLETCPAPSSALVLRRAALAGPWNEAMRVADDWCLVLDMVLARPTRAGFTLTPHWKKSVQQDNVYDGRAQLEVIERLGFHDEKLMAQRFADRLSPAERRLLRRRMSRYHFEYAYHSWKAHGTSARLLGPLGAAFRLAPAHLVGHLLGSVWVFGRARWRALLAAPATAAAARGGEG